MADLLGIGLNGATTLVAAFGGFVLAGWNQRRGDERAAVRDREQHLRELRSRLAEDRHREQLELLRTVQEELHEVGRNLAQIIHNDVTLVEVGADSSVLPDGIAAKDQDARIRLQMHGSRILDDEVRDLVEELNGTVASLVLPSLLSMNLTVREARNEADRRLGELVRLVNPAIARSGQALRAEEAWEPPAA